MAQQLYQRLQIGERMIRLLSLDQASSSDFTLSVVSLPKSLGTWPEYKALSYAWQEAISGAAASKTISCNGCRLRIPINLFAALAWLRQKLDGPVTLWVDYLCINQSDKKERGQQVELMQEIFSNSSEVLIWLGQPATAQIPTSKVINCYHWEGMVEDEVLVDRYRLLHREFVGKATSHPSTRPPESEASSTYEELSSKLDVFGAFCLFSLLSRRVPVSTITFYESSVWSMKQQEWETIFKLAIKSIADRAWWKRTWVVQECVLAKVATVHYGPLSASWEMFGRAAMFYIESRPSYDVTRNPMGDPLAKLCGLVMQVESLREAFRHGQSLSPIQIFRRFHGRQATDPRDKIFGFLGLSKSQLLSPDYGLSTVEVYLQAARSIIAMSRNLEFLAGTGSSTRAGLPSWSPDWNFPPRENEWRRLQCLSLYNASKGMPPPTAGIHMMSLAAILEVSGIWLDKVEYVVEEPAPDDGFHRFQTTKAQWEDSIRRELGFSALLAYNGWTGALPEEQWATRGYAEDFWRALCGDIIHTWTGQRAEEGNYQRAGQDGYGSYHIWAKDEKMGRSRLTLKGERTFHHARDDSTNRTRNQFLYGMHTMTAERVMFITQTGRIGVGPPKMTAGDHIALLSGSPVPLVLRTVSEHVNCRGRVERLLQPPIQAGGGDAQGVEMRGLQQTASNSTLVARIMRWVRGQFVAGPQNSATCQSTHECHRIIGDAYVSRVMDGEAVDGNIGLIQKIFLV